MYAGEGRAEDDALAETEVEAETDGGADMKVEDVGVKGTEKECWSWPDGR